MPSVSPRCRLNESPPTAWTTPSMVGKLDPQVADLEQDLAGAHQSYLTRGSSHA